MAKFKVGDKVISTSWQKGVTGVIVRQDKIDGLFVVAADSEANVATPSFKENEKRCFFHFGSELQLIEQPRRKFIVIHRSGNVMTAERRVNREVIKSAKATCSENDTFDFNTGAKLAFDRLMGREEPKPAPKPLHRFKVGDDVIVSGWGSGTVVEISEVTPFPYIVEVDNPRKQRMYFSEDRLSPAPAPEPPKYYTGKVVCVEWKGDIFRHKSAGRIAIITNGISDYDGWNRLSKPFESFSDFCSANNFGVFYEIKE